MVEVSVDQVVLVRSAARVLAEAAGAGLKKASPELAVAYEGRCVTDGTAADEAGAPSSELLARGVLVARAGIGFPAPVHLERFASPARLCVTDEPRLAGVGGTGMMTLVVPTASLAQALVRGTVFVRPPVSVQVSLTGRLRPFVCPRDVALELVRRGLPDIVRRVEESRGAPVVVEFAGPSARALSVGERSVLAGIAPQLGASAAVFVSDERTEVFLRDQRRSKAYRALAPDAGAPCEDVLAVDLGAVDPLLLDEEGHVRVVRDLAGQPVTQVVLGGDSGATLRDLLAVAALLKSKRVPPRLDFLLAPPSRQMLEVLAEQGALTDLAATGVRLIEPDLRVVTGELYPRPRSGVSLRTSDPEPRAPGRSGFVVASPETLAFAVASGHVGDPRAFKRPVRVTVPRTLPTDDVLLVRKGESRKGERVEAPRVGDGTSARFRPGSGGAGDLPSASPRRGQHLKERPVATPFSAWRTAQTLELVDRAALEKATSRNGHTEMAVVCTTLDEVRELAEHAPEIAHTVRAVLAPYIPSSLVALLSAAGVAALRFDAATAKSLKGHKSIALPPPSQWAERDATTVQVGTAKLPITWLAQGPERAWAMGSRA
jgi:aconitate hydratase